MSASRLMTDPEIGIPDLVRRLTDDSGRLIRDEVRLAKLEAGDAMHTALRGSMWLAVAFGAGVVALTALTVLLTMVIGRLLLGNVWAGALITGALEIVAGGLMLRYAVALYREPASYTFGATRAEIAETARWAKSPTSSTR